MGLDTHVWHEVWSKFKAISYHIFNQEALKEQTFLGDISAMLFYHIEK